MMYVCWHNWDSRLLPTGEYVGGSYDANQGMKETDGVLPTIARGCTAAAKIKVGCSLPPMLRACTARRGPQLPLSSCQLALDPSARGAQASAATPLPSSCDQLLTARCGKVQTSDWRTCQHCIQSQDFVPAELTIYGCVEANLTAFCNSNRESSCARALAKTCGAKLKVRGDP
jgi:hypothetical protein